MTSESSDAVKTANENLRRQAETLVEANRSSIRDHLRHNNAQAVKKLAGGLVNSRLRTAHANDDRYKLADNLDEVLKMAKTKLDALVDELSKDKS